MDDHLAHFPNDLHQICNLAVIEIPAIQYIRIIAGTPASEASAGTQSLTICVLALAEIAEVLFTAVRFGRRLLLDLCPVGASRAACCRDFAIRAFRIFRALRRVRCLLGRPHGRVQRLRLLLHVRPAAAPLLFFLFIHKLHLDFHVQSTSFRENLIQNADKFIGCVLAQGGFRKFHFQDITLREADFRAPEQVVLQHAVITQLKKNTVLIEPHQGLRVVLSRQLVALQDLYRNVSVAKQLPF